jgi:serine/threonine-protein kinase RsbW
MGTFHAELVLPNDVAGLGIARRFVTDLVEMARLGDEAGPVVVDATVEACANVIDHAYEPGEDATFRIAGDVDAAGLHLRVHDTGLKYDASARLAPGKDRTSAEGGLARIRAAFDTVEWVNRGRAGKELHLVKHRPAALLDTSGLAVDADDDEVPLAPEQDYEVRLFRPDDALGVCRVIYRNYGNTYFHEACYFPERMVAMNETGELASVVPSPPTARWSATTRSNGPTSPASPSGAWPWSARPTAAATS